MWWSTDVILWKQNKSVEGEGGEHTKNSKLRLSGDSLQKNQTNHKQTKSN